MSIPSIRLIYAPRAQLTMPALGPGGLCWHQNFCYMIFEHFYWIHLKFLLDASGKKEVWGGGELATLQYLVMLKK